MTPRLASFAIAPLLLVCWSLEARPSGPVQALACAPGRSDVAAALVGDSVWTTGDGGRTWSRAAVLPRPLTDEGEVGGHAAADPLWETGSVLPGLEESALEEEQHRVGEADFEAQGGSEVAGDEGATNGGPLIAVGDDLTWAALVGERLYIGQPGAGVKANAEVHGAAGLYVDRGGGVWVTVSGALLFFDGSSGWRSPRRYPLAGAGQPVPGVRPGEILVPARDGILEVRRRVGQVAELVLDRVGPISALAVGPHGELVLVSRGRIERRSPGTVPVDLGPAPGSVVRLYVDRKGTCWIQTADGRWSSDSGGGSRASTALAVAVDADGRLWLGTPHGPIGPAEAIGPPARQLPLSGVAVAPFVSAAMAAIDRELGDPPCRKPFNPLPRAGLVIGFGRGSTREIELPGPIEQAGLTTWIYVELGLSWSFGPVSPTECAARLEAAAELRDERRRQVATLVAAWRNAAAMAEAAEGLSEIAAATLERDRLAELIRILSGILPEEEKR